MRDHKFLFTFVTPEKEFFSNKEVQEIICPATTGQLNILPCHAPLAALIGPGKLSYKIQNKWESLPVSGGFLEVHPQGVRVLAEPA